MRCSAGSPRRTGPLEACRDEPTADRGGRWSGRRGRGKLSRSMTGGRSGAERAVAVLLVVLGGCYPVGTGYRSLHVVDGEVVQSPPPPPSAYEAYLRARVALEQEPPQLSEARYFIARALQMDPRDPHLWATQAEIEERAGQVEQAAVSARRALAIRPGYPPAQQVLARLEGGSPGAAATASTTSATTGARQP
jgi:hypothetical protein